PRDQSSGHGSDRFLGVASARLRSGLGRRGQIAAGALDRLQRGHPGGESGAEDFFARARVQALQGEAHDVQGASRRERAVRRLHRRSRFDAGRAPGDRRAPAGGAWPGRPRPRSFRLHRGHDGSIRHPGTPQAVRSGRKNVSGNLKNDLLLRALLREPTPRRPVWLMRQAGRYLPEYRALRARAGSFLAMCTQPEIACEVTLQPIDRYPLDAAILFSDILTIPHAMNLGLQFESGEGPKFARPVRSAADIDRLWLPDPGRELKYVVDAVALIRRELAGRVPLIGFAGSPWTVGTYMVEGGSSKGFGLIKRMMYQTPGELHRLLGKLTRATILYLNAQI